MKIKSRNKVKKKEIVEFYNNFVDELARENYPEAQYSITRLKLLDAELSKIENDNILDVGGGAGLLVPVLYKNTKTLTETDLSPRLVKKAKERYRNLKSIKFMTADAENLKFADKSFDVVVCSEAIEHMLKPEKALKELCRVARKAILITTPNVFNKKSLLVRFVKLFHKTNQHSGQIYDQKVELSKIRKTLEENKFKITKVKGLYYPFTPRIICNFLEKINIAPSYASCLYIKAEAVK
ncbi:MAG: class I SAM-dependent methyltransferase [Candidatus Aenigmarchaeota archaeon]|nr:class I SAM-dependent methyltransferase [Candidatus Aenigmarchaeota archaeon]